MTQPCRDQKAYEPFHGLEIDRTCVLGGRRRIARRRTRSEFHRLHHGGSGFGGAAQLLIGRRQQQVCAPAGRGDRDRSFEPGQRVFGAPHEQAGPTSPDRPQPARNLRRIEPVGLLEGGERVVETAEKKLGEPQQIKGDSVPWIEGEHPVADHQTFDEAVGCRQKPALRFEHRDVVGPRAQGALHDRANTALG